MVSRDRRATWEDAPMRPGRLLAPLCLVLFAVAAGVIVLAAPGDDAGEVAVARTFSANAGAGAGGSAGATAAAQRRADARSACRERAALFPSPGRIRDAQRWARRRAGVVALAVATPGGRVAARGGSRRFSSASLVKALLLTARLRAAGDAPLDPGARATLEPMIRSSDNDAALATYAATGRPGLASAGRAAGMRRLVLEGWSLFDAQVTAPDMARLLVGVDRLAPPRHRRFALRLLRDVVPEQRWGIARAVRGRNTVFFKGGWRPGLVHQAALVRRPGGERIGLAVLTEGSPTQRHGERTIEGVARRLLPRPDPRCAGGGG
jgi:hypothetical protein